MPELNNIKSEIVKMSQIALEMWQLTFQAFMEHDLDLFPAILEKENKLNELDNKITADLIEVGRKSSLKKENLRISVYADIVGDLELIGDYCKDILERVQIKIEERLLFSEDAVSEYRELYQRTEKALAEVVTVLEKAQPSLLKEVLKKEEHIDSLVDEYRRRHNQRLISGICSPLACNMFLNMLDFTAAIYYHTKKIARNLLKMK